MVIWRWLVPHSPEPMRTGAELYRSLDPQAANAAATAIWRWLVLRLPELVLAGAGVYSAARSLKQLESHPRQSGAGSSRPAIDI